MALLYQGPDCLAPGDVNPYVTSVVHFYWIYLDELYQIFQKMDRLAGQGYPAKLPVSELGSINCSYYVNTESCTVYATPPSTCSAGGYVIWNGKLSRDLFQGWAYEDMLYDLLRIYKAVRKSANMCSTSVGKPNAHDIADAYQAVQMIRHWRTL